MNITGLDYNRERERLVLPEYGREVQSMVDHATTIEDRSVRQRCAENIIEIMERMFPQNKESADYKRRLWDQLAIMSDFKLDIDYPYDVSEARKIATKPDPLPYPMTQIPVRHYGKMVFDMLEKLKTMPAGRERDSLVQVTANQMKRNLHQWGHGAVDDEKVIDDIARYTDGVIQIDPATFKFEPVSAVREPKEKKKRKR